MTTTSIATTTAPAAQMSLVRSFAEINASLERQDAFLETAARMGNARPRKGDHQHLLALASSIDTARAGLTELKPEARALDAALVRDARDPNDASRYMALMERNNLRFKGEWSTRLDTPITNVRGALDPLTDATAEPITTPRSPGVAPRTPRSAKRSTPISAPTPPYRIGQSPRYSVRPQRQIEVSNISRARREFCSTPRQRGPAYATDDAISGALNADAHPQRRRAPSTPTRAFQRCTNHASCSRS